MGQDVGSPVITVPGSGSAADPIAFFSPVVSPSPKGEDAGRLRDGVVDTRRARRATAWPADRREWHGCRPDRP
ncbi:hypothetical protein ACFRR7_35375 [Streptomyces sp. NPDC056909]|uniref:mycothiol-dependent nitroreductase Rv2466c family protein n=1 Tax=Streptomyces sp. NPDC056909 TaxID=3345963 RepID=UPI0036BDE859